MGSLAFLFVFMAAAFGASETRQRVVIIDTGITPFAVVEKYVCKDGNRDFTGRGLYDSNGHGSNIAGIIARSLNPNTQCLTILKYYHNGGESRNFWAYWGSIYAHVLALPNVRWINISSYGELQDARELQVLTQLIAQGVHISVAAGNDGLFLKKGCKLFPTCYDINSPYWHVVASGGNTLHSFSNWGEVVTDIADGYRVRAGGFMLSGTSQACAKVTAALVGGFYGHR